MPGPITAVCAHNDEIAIMLQLGTAAQGLTVPGDLAIIGGPAHRLWRPVAGSGSRVDGQLEGGVVVGLEAGVLVTQRDAVRVV